MSFLLDSFYIVGTTAKRISSFVLRPLTIYDFVVEARKLFALADLAANEFFTSREKS